ncbi:MAG: acetyl esterase/lipase [Myxococcota bacterium]|jgi:acetyl esterase/lipase
MIDTPDFHPDLRRQQAWLPRGLGRSWLLPLLRGVFGLSAALVRREQVTLASCSVYLNRPASPPEGTQAALLWIHGGGLIMGDARQDDAFLQHIADEHGILVASVQHRLAPKHPFPAPLDDCEQALRWLAGQADVDSKRIAVGGSSAGAGLAAALCQRVRNTDVHPAFQLLVYPMLDDRSASGSAPEDAMHRVWDRRSNTLGWDSYLKGHDRTNLPAHAVPGRTEDLAGLPPAWIGVGTFDLFHDEDVDYARRLREAGVSVQLEVIEGAYHGFDAMDAKAPVSRAFRASQIAALAKHLRAEPEG